MSECYKHEKERRQGSYCPYCFIAALEHKVDELMLEYCPDDMTPEQLERWGRHQVPHLEMDDAL